MKRMNIKEFNELMELNNIKNRFMLDLMNAVDEMEYESINFYRYIACNRGGLHKNKTEDNLVHITYMIVKTNGKFIKLDDIVWHDNTNEFLDWTNSMKLKFKV